MRFCTMRFDQITISDEAVLFKKSVEKSQDLKTAVKKIPKLLGAA